MDSNQRQDTHLRLSKAELKQEV